jgi:hypothetical protein
MQGVVMSGRVQQVVRLVAASVLVWSVPAGTAFAATKTISWSDGVCANRLVFDPGKVDEPQLQNTVHLLFGPADFEAPTLPPLLTQQDVAKVDLEATSRQCSGALDAAARLPFLPLKGIEEFRQARIGEIKDICAYQAAFIRGLKNASALRDYRPAAACSGFIDALEGKKDLQASFREVLAENCSLSVSPGECAQRGFADLSKPDGIERARLYLTVYGWSNCAVKYNTRNTEAQKLEQMRAGLDAQFRRTFKVVQNKCDAPVDSHRELGEAARFETDIAPSTPSNQWNVVAAGLFCGSRKLYPGSIVLYIYGIGADRLSDSQPIAATFEIDGKPTPLAFRPYNDMALAPVEAGFVRDLLNARSASIRIKDYNSPNADRIKLDDAASKVRSALKRCYKP